MRFLYRLLFDTSWLYRESDEYKDTWCLLRAVEWGYWPLFVAQPIAPIALIYIPAEWVAACLVALTWLWAGVRYRFVSPQLANFGMLVADLKWYVGIGVGFYFLSQDRIAMVAISVFWPLVTVALLQVTPRATKLESLQSAMALRL